MKLATILALAYAATGWIPGAWFMSKQLEKSRALDKARRDGATRHYGLDNTPFGEVNAHDFLIVVALAFLLFYVLTIGFAMSSYLFAWWDWALHATPVPTRTPERAP